MIDTNKLFKTYNIDCNRQNTCILVVTYNPDADFRANACQFLNIVDNIVVVDNGSNNDVIELINSDIIQHFHIIQAKENRGIAWALNKGIEWGISNGFKYILTFDQDSFPSCEILKCYNEVIKKIPNIGLIGTSFSTTSLDILSSEVVEKLTVITSGLLHPVATIEAVGLYKESLFIDSVDFDYSLRVKKIGYKIVRTKTPYIIHHLGSPIKRFGIKSSNHSFVRRYYMARNHIYMCRKYGLSFPFFILKKDLFFVKSIIQMLIVEDNRYKKLKYTLKGLIDGFSFK